MSRDEFIKYFVGVVERVLKKELPAKASEGEFMEKSYDCIYKKVRHIKTGE